MQALAVASAVFPLFWMGRHLLESSRAGVAAALVWLLAPDVHLGLMFDYNPTLLGASGLLWTAWALFCSRLGVALPIALLTCLSKENTCLYVVVLGGVAALRGVPRRRALGVAAVAVALFVIEMTVLFPRFRSGGFRHWEFEELGDTPAETAAAAVTRPHAAVDLLMNHPQKRRALLQPLAASGFLGARRPAVARAAAPQLGRALPLDAPHALVGLPLRRAGRGHRADRAGARLAAAAGGGPRRAGPAALRRRLRAARRPAAAVPHARRQPAERPLPPAPALRGGARGRRDHARGRRVRRPRPAREGRRAGPPAPGARRPARDLHARPRGRRRTSSSCR